MNRRWQVRLEDIDRYGAIAARVNWTREVADRNPQHVFGEMLGDAIVAMAPDDAANVLHALIHRLAVLGDESLRPFGKLASLWRIWQMRGGDDEKVYFGDFVTVEEDQ